MLIPITLAYCVNKKKKKSSECYGKLILTKMQMIMIFGGNDTFSGKFYRQTLVFDF